MWKIPVHTTKKVKGKVVKTLAFESKYPKKEQAESARYSLIRIANCAHKAPCDITINSDGAQLIQNPSWSVCEVACVN